MELKFDNLTKEFGNFTAVDHLNLTMTKGVYGLLKRGRKNHLNENAVHPVKANRRKNYL